MNILSLEEESRHDWIICPACRSERRSRNVEQMETYLLEAEWAFEVTE